MIFNSSLCLMALLSSTATRAVEAAGEDPSCDVPESSAESLKSGANDVIVVRQSDGELLSTPFVMMVGKFSNWRTIFKSRQGRQVTITINGLTSPVRMTIGDSGEACFTRRANKRNFTHEELQLFQLKKGINHGVYRVDSLKVEIPFLVYLVDPDQKLVFTDVDGTITEEDVAGRVFPAFGLKANHDGVVRLLDEVVRNGYMVVYLTARSMGEDSGLREYLFETLDDTDGGHSLPFGPVFMSPKTMAEAVVEAFVTGPEYQKAETLRSVVALFDSGGDDAAAAGVVAGAYGNKDSDVRAYAAAGVPADRVFIVDTDGHLRSVGDGSVSSYPRHADAVDALYPPV